MIALLENSIEKALENLFLFVMDEFKRIHKTPESIISGIYVESIFLLKF